MIISLIHHMNHKKLKNQIFVRFIYFLPKGNNNYLYKQIAFKPDVREIVEEMDEILPTTIQTQKRIIIDNIPPFAYQFYQISTNSNELEHNTTGYFLLQSTSYVGEYAIYILRDTGPPSFYRHQEYLLSGKYLFF